VSETINLTITENITEINLEMAEESPIYVNFRNIAIPDAAVNQAKLDAQAAATAAAASAAASAASAAAAENSAVDAAASAAAYTDNSLVNALIFG
jgi:phage tail protein X